MNWRRELFEDVRVFLSVCVILFFVQTCSDDSCTCCNATICNNGSGTFHLAAHGPCESNARTFLHGDGQKE